MRNMIPVAVMVAILMPGLMAAQRLEDSWDNLRQLVPGEGIRIVLNDAKSYRVTFESFDEGGIVVRTSTGQQTYARNTVLRVSSKGRSHRLRNALIGAGIGGGFMGANAAATHSSDPESAAIAAVVGIPFAALVGAGVGAVMPTGGWHDVYRARSTPATAPRNQAGRQ